MTINQISFFSSLNSYWCRRSDRPAWISQNRSQHVESVNVFSAIFRGHIIGPYTFEGGRNNQISYRHMLETQVFPR